ncbi:MAG: hypothetical protein PHE53_05820 [Thermoguttaceae bacterium]|nr:hypothetical protein [Thermoguttaceae bacterium]
MNHLRDRIPSQEWLGLCTIGADVVAAFWFVNAFEGELRLSGRLGSVWGLLGIAVVLFHVVSVIGDAISRAGRDAVQASQERTKISETTETLPLPPASSSKRTWRKILFFLAIGVGFSGTAGWLGSAAYPHWDRMSAEPLLTAAAFTIVVLLTVRFFTHPDLRPLSVGLRRMCGWLLGMSVAKAASTAFYEFELSANAAFEWSKKVETWCGFTKSQWCAALAIGVYVAGVTWIRGRSTTPPQSTAPTSMPNNTARNRSTDNAIADDTMGNDAMAKDAAMDTVPSDENTAKFPVSATGTSGEIRAELIAGMSATLAGIFILIPLPHYLVGLDATFQSDRARWSILIGALALLAFLRNFRAFRTPQATFADGVARQGMLSVIFLDAAICATTGGMLGAAAVLLLLVPAFLVDRQLQRSSSFGSLDQ